MQFSDDPTGSAPNYTPLPHNLQLHQIQMQYLQTWYWYQAMQQAQAYWAWQASMWEQSAPPLADGIKTSDSPDGEAAPYANPTKGEAQSTGDDPTGQADKAQPQERARDKVAQPEKPFKVLSMGSSRPVFEPPRDKVEEQLTLFAQLWLKHSKVGIHDNFFDLGGNYLLAQQLQNHIRHIYNIEISLDQIYENGSLLSIAEKVKAHVANRTAKESQSAVAPAQTAAETDVRKPQPHQFKPLPFRSIVRVRAGAKERSNLYCVHGAGGNVLFMQRWIKYLGGQSLYGIQARGVDGVVHHLPESIEEMASNYIEELRQQQPSGPYWIAGYSVGGIIALEIATQLVAAGAEVPYVIFFDTYHTSINARQRTLPEIVSDATHQPGRFLGKLVENKIRSRLRPQRSFAEQLAEYRFQSEPVPLEARADLIERHIDHLAERYTPPRYTGRTLLITAEELWQIYDHADEYRGWRNTIPHIELCTVPGDHFSLIKEPNVGQAIRAVNRVMGVGGESRE